jgi:hypothetical protein
LETLAARRAAVDLIGTDLNEKRQAMLPHSFEQRLGANNVRMKERGSILNAPIDMAFRCEVDHSVEPRVQELVQSRRIRNVSPNKGVAGITNHVGEVFQIAGVGQLVKVQDLNIFAAPKEIADKVRANKPRSTCDE